MYFFAFTLLLSERAYEQIIDAGAPGEAPWQMTDDAVIQMRLP
jgi:hypothetical protein